MLASDRQKCAIVAQIACYAPYLAYYINTIPCGMRQYSNLTVKLVVLAFVALGIPKQHKFFECSCNMPQISDVELSNPLKKPKHVLCNYF